MPPERDGWTVNGLTLEGGLQAFTFVHDHFLFRFRGF
jgi:hypothetical protein